MPTTSPSSAHRRRVKPVGALITALLLSACAAPSLQTPSAPEGLLRLEQEHQQATMLHSQQESLTRLSRLAWPLARAADELCPKPLEASLGVRLANRHFFAEKLRPAALRELHVGDVLQVLAVVPDSPAARAGVQPGDHLIQLGGRDLPVAEKATTELRPMLEQLQPQQTIELQLVRAEQTLTLPITPAAVCHYPLVLLARDSVNAYADNRTIQVTRGLLAFADDDWELSFVIAHELAHNLLGHVPATIRNGTVGGLVDLWLLASGVPSPGLMALAGSRAYSQEFEAEADYLALYLMARAGLPLDHDADYWRRVAAWRQGGATPVEGTTHPDTSRRYLAMQQTLEEIRDKQQAGQPLLPTRPASAR